MGVIQSSLAALRRIIAVPALAGAGAALLLAACTDSRGGPIAYSPSDFGPPDPPSIATLEAGYRIAPMDTLSVSVFRMPDLSGDYQVDLTGQISLPLIGEVPAANLTTAELDKELTSRFGQKYLENPDVSVGIKASARKNVTIDGAVKNAGAFPVSGPLSLMQAVALAGGASDDANLRRVAIFRQIDGKRQAAAFDLLDVRRGQSEDPAIYPGDIVVVDGSSVKEVQKKLLNSLPILSIFRPF